MINSQSYSKLSTVSSKLPQRQPGKFFKVFITGAPREQQDVGKYQCMYDFDNQGYLVNNSKRVLFIPYFYKRYWEKTDRVKAKDGREYDKVVAFGWPEDMPKIDDTCRYVYLIAGLLMNENNQPVTLPCDIPEKGLKKGEPAWIYFVCNGVRYGSAIKLLNDIAEAAKPTKMKPLSDDMEFERNVVSPRRFLLAAETTIQQTNFGPKTVPAFKIVQQLPDQFVSKIIETSDKMLPEFEKQFDKTEYVKSTGGGGVASVTNDGPTPTISSVGMTFDSEPSEPDASIPSMGIGLPDSSADNSDFSKFDIGI